MKSLYFDCETGISGDMIVASLLDLGADEGVLHDVLSGIKEDGFRIEIKRVKKSEILCVDFDVVLDKKHENHDHDMEYLYGKEEEPAYHHEHHRDHHHEHRNLNDVYEIIDSLKMSDRARELSKKVFLILAKAEAKAHGRSIEEVHFHEVGAIDSIVDIVSASVCLDDLSIDEVFVKRICEGHGTVRTRHGVLPVPVPAVLNIASAYGLPLELTDRKGEFVTPTGAAFVAAVRENKDFPKIITPKKIGYGAGKREHEVPGILRAVMF